MTASPLQFLGERRIPYLRVSGDAHARGLQRGQALRDMVVSRFERALAELRKGAAWAVSCAVADRFQQTLAARDPDVLQVLRGIADGANLPWDDYRVAVMGAGGWFRLDCSVFAAGGAATVDGQLILGKNGDLEPPFMDEHDVFVQQVTPDRGYRFIEMGVYPERAYQPDGMNERGLAIVGCGQRVRDGLDAWRAGRDVGLTLYDAMHRLYTQCATVDEALAVLHEAPRGYSGRTLVVGDASGRWAKVELSYDRIAVFEPEPDRHYPGNFVCAGVSGTLSAAALRPLITGIHERPSSYRRYDRYMDLLGRHAGRIDQAFARALLRDTHPEPGENSICKYGSQPTLESFLFAPQQRRIWALKGDPHRSGFVELGFD